MASIVRLYVDHPLGKAQCVELTRDQAHYLFGVMRKDLGDVVAVFNGYDGEWQATVIQAGKKHGALSCVTQSKPQQNPPDLWLLFAPIKKTRTDFIVEKAAELGVARIVPVQTDFTNSDRIRVDRLQAHAIEAAEQCGGTFVPTAMELQKLSKVLDGWDNRNILFCDEALVGSSTMLQTTPGPCAILVGPEGGFSPAERARLHEMPQSRAISLGPRILRADTAAVAALTLWQHALGDWSQD